MLFYFKGGAIAVSLGSNVTGSALTFSKNFAIDGLGNDVAMLGEVGLGLGPSLRLYYDSYTGVVCLVSCGVVH